MSERFLVALSFLSLLSLVVSADVVHVVELVSLDGVVSTNSDITLSTGRRYETSSAPAKSGWRFTHWSTTAKQEFSGRDDWGRAYDAASYTLYEATTFTAHYIPASRDNDGDGLPDGWELYWYGDCAKYGAGDDPDNDGVVNAAEFAANTNPIFPEGHAPGPVVYADGDLWLYNPSNYAPYTITCEPEGSLFETVTAYVRQGTKVTTGTYGTATAKFACWKVNGVQQRDDWGRAVDVVSLAMPTQSVEIVAVTVKGDSDGDGIEDRLELYWYGDLDEGAAGDTDGDGKTFAQEIEAGTNPLMAENHEDGPVTYADDTLWQYNPYGLQPYTLKSDPEGALFETTSAYVKQGTKVSSAAYATSTGFAYWKFNGVPQRDYWGRAGDSVSFAMPTNAVELVAVKVSGDSDGDGIDDNLELYWYGDLDETATSDTDGDGKTFAQEIAAGTNPLMAENHEDGPVAYIDTVDHELNLQVYEQVLGALVDSKYTELFTSPIVSNNATSVTFGGDRVWSIGGVNGIPIWPVVADVNGDGLWDLIVCSAATTNVFVNTGTKGNPQFEERSDLIKAAAPWCGMNSTAKLDDLTLDVAPVGALSAATNAATMLVSDADGRIWYYLNSSTSQPLNFILQHKVWGGSYAGFANGLMLAVVDWEDDGDLDCVCGTAEGKLMLLRDPKVGRPTGLTAAAGVDNVKLDWEPNGQSRVRGYKVYRAVGGSTDYGVRGAPALPTFRDTGLSTGTYGYKVSALSRFYTAGNSTPTETESIATDPVSATVGGVKFFWNDVDVKLGEQASVMFSIENACNFNVAGVTQTVAYATEYLKPVDVIPSGLAENVTYDWSYADGTITIALKSGILAPGSGKFFTLVFDTLKVGTTKVGEATVTIAEIAALFMLGDVNGDAELTTADLRLMAKLCSVAGRKYNANQLKAGDFNGDGKLTMADYQLMRTYFKGKGIL